MKCPFNKSELINSDGNKEVIFNECITTECSSFMGEHQECKLLEDVIMSLRLGVGEQFLNLLP